VNPSTYIRFDYFPSGKMVSSRGLFFADEEAELGLPADPAARYSELVAVLDEQSGDRVTVLVSAEGELPPERDCPVPTLNKSLF